MCARFLLPGLVVSACVRAPDGVSFDDASDPSAGTVSAGTESSSGEAETDAGTGDGTGDTTAGTETSADASGDGTGGSSETGAPSETTSAETGSVAGGCAAGATTVLATSPQTVVLPGALRSPGMTQTAPHGSIHIVSSGDLCGLSITLTPDDSDIISATLRDPDGLAIDGAECVANVAGAPCTIDLADGPGEPAAMRLELRDDADDILGSFTIAVTATTEGLAAPVTIDSAFRNLEQADFVLFAVGPATGTYAYGWSTDTDTSYNIGFIAPSGQMTPILDTLDPGVATWPASAQQGWYLISTSTTNPSGLGDPWSLGIQPV